MKLHKIASTTLVVLSLITTAQASSKMKLPLETKQSLGNLTAFYGDIMDQRIVGIDVKNMKLSSETYTDGVKPYTVGRADGKNGVLNKLYGMTRKSPWIEIIDLNTREITGKIALPHTPRSCAYNEVLGLQLVSGVDKPMASLIEPKTDTVIASVGRNVLVSPQDSGGSNATGHPVWLNSNTFAILDREVRKIDVYGVKKVSGEWQVTLLSSLDTPTSAHHFVGKGTDGMDGGITLGQTNTDTFYVITEGSIADNISPAVLEVKLSNNQLHITRTVPFNKDHHQKHEESEDGSHSTSGHHATLHPDGKHLYVGSAVGQVLIIDLEKMQLIKKIPSGQGSGHITFVPQRNLAIVTNHRDTFLTIIDSKKHKKIKDLTVSGPSINDAIMQSHTSFTDAKGDFFYAFASNNGFFYEVNLDTLTVTRKLYTGGTPVQGCFTWLGAEDTLVGSLIPIYHMLLN